MHVDEFFDSTEQLNNVRQWAHARFAAKWAVFLAVLLRVSASTSPGVQLPGVIGGPASLNLIGAFVSPSGGGKGISDKVAKLAWPTPIIERPIGSGEGIAALFAPPKKEGAEHITRAIVNVSEIDSLAGIAGRQGSILLAQLKSAVMGELIGQSNASEATTRIVLPHTYRMCMSIGAQPGHCDVIFNDTTGGTPQRVLWAPTIDPTMPADVRPDPEPLNTRLPSWAHQDTEITYGFPEIREQIISAHIARQRGEPDALDGHRMLTKCKVAAVLAIMHHRSVVGELDWELAETVLSVSDSTRDWIVHAARTAEQAKIHSRAMARASGDEFVSDQKLGRAKAAVLRWLDRDGESAANDIRRKLKADLREHFGAAVAELAADGLIAEIHRDRGMRYRLSEKVQGVPLVHPQNPQFRDGVLAVQRVPAPLAVEPDIPSSTVQVDQSAPVQPEKGKHPRRQTFARCESCYICLPSAATSLLCDDCRDLDPRRELRPKTLHPALAVVHNGSTTRNGMAQPFLPASKRQRTAT
ncbi:hypothetical protein [Mycolicibacterium psychrotolerans]|uniref:DUF3987 domain-containing protein n=1 Tax=Mycolicibacterium psychrotolerans TaxID=216929 RepID=A0A7I7M6L1_9MYCO|nr:hypothetical protein [Mycolicibacterium psychrotolerans]BBX67818.1 hypothetical protein MPSYJ_12790 [Mycolicibacterium psychrotolerans]